MAIVKVNFTNDCETQSIEMFNFLKTYASEYFDSIVHPEEGNGKHAINIECTVNKASGQTVLSFDYYTQSSSQVKYCTLYVSDGSSFSWGTSNQTECLYGVATKKGVALVFRGYSNCMVVAISKTTEGHTFLYMPRRPNQYIFTSFGDMYTGEQFSGVNVSYQTSPVVTFFSLDTNTSSGVALCAMCPRYGGTYSLDLLRVAYSQFYLQIGIITLNNIKYFSNGMIALKDE